MVECRHRIPGLDIDIVGSDGGLYIEEPSMGGWADMLDRTDLVARFHVHEYGPDQIEVLLKVREEVRSCRRFMRRRRRDTVRRSRDG